jgi:hypothetical protein
VPIAMASGLVIAGKTTTEYAHKVLLKVGDNILTIFVA